MKKWQLDNEGTERIQGPEPEPGRGGDLCCPFELEKISERLVKKRKSRLAGLPSRFVKRSAMDINLFLKGKDEM
jgi:hypothetical protein